jgi:hypothetical protein
MPLRQWKEIQEVLYELKMEGGDDIFFQDVISEAPKRPQAKLSAYGKGCYV